MGKCYSGARDFLPLVHARYDLPLPPPLPSSYGGLSSTEPGVLSFFNIPQHHPPPPLPSSSSGPFSTEPGVFTFFSLPLHPMMFPPPPPPPIPHPCFNGLAAAFPPGNFDPRVQELSSHYNYPYPPPPPEVFWFVNLPPQPMIFPPPRLPCPYFTEQLPLPSNSPTRSLSLFPVPHDVTESTLRRDLEIFGDVRGVEMERISEGIVTVHFYNLRDAKRAVREFRGRHMQQQARLGDGGGSVWSSPSSSSTERGFVSGRPVWAQFVVPGDFNQGTLVIFNVDPDVSSIALREIFQVYGPIKELREMPFKQNKRCIEFFDIRDAVKAFSGMNGKEICGKQVVIEFSRPHGLENKFWSSWQPLPPPPSSSSKAAYYSFGR